MPAGCRGHEVGPDFHSSNARPLTWALLAALALHALAILGNAVPVLPVPTGGLAPRLMNITLVEPVRATREPGATALPGPSVPVESAAPEPPAKPAPLAPEPLQADAEPPPAPAPMPAQPKTPASAVRPPASVARPGLPGAPELQPVPKPAAPVPGKPAAAKPPGLKPAAPVSESAKPDARPPAVQDAAPGNQFAPRPFHAAELMNRSLQMARSATDPQDETGSAREKRVDLSAMTMDEDFYLQAWMRKVEQVGSLNFPDAARRLNQPGGPTLAVAVRADGSIKSIHTVRSSGDQALDDAARQIVNLAAPFAPFPEAMRRDYDVLHIVRRWKFDRGQLYGQ